MTCLALLQKGAAEFIATAMLVFSACQINTAKEGVLGAALGIGLTLACMAAAFGHISGGHMNPAVSLAVLLIENLTIIELVVYVISQIAGSIIGGLLSRLAMNNETWVDIAGGMVTLDSDMSISQGILLEGVVTFVLVITILLTVEQSIVGTPLYIGLAAVVGILHSGSLTGGALNPARAFGPAFTMWALNDNQYKRKYNVGVWDNHWIYWVGPSVGATIAAILYRLVFADYNHRIVKRKPKVDDTTNEPSPVQMNRFTTNVEPVAPTAPTEAPVETS